ncbi:hypothetical protein [Streptomyces sp. NPDC056061]
MSMRAVLVAAVVTGFLLGAAQVRGHAHAAVPADGRSPASAGRTAGAP